ncbi:MAG: right-handed parallel beta-helix repeat-containing protein, partial [Phycisphaerales bacterium]
MSIENRFRMPLAASFILPLVISAAYGKVIYVDDDAAGAHDGSNWANAYPCLQAALAVAQSGDEIRVAKGIYKPDRSLGTGRFSAIVASGDRAATFHLINGVAVRGGYAGSGGPDADARDIELYETILSGDLSGDDGPDFTNNAENSYHVVTGSESDTTAVLEGVTITGGNANGVKPYHAGGGIYSLSGSLSSSPTLIHCTFSANRGNAGGAMANDGPGNAVLMNCTFIGNSADNYGGAIYNLGSSPLLTDCEFIGNSATDGGGILNWNDCRPTLTNCTFRGNSARSDGGAIHCHNSGMDIERSSMIGNSAQHYGGGIYCDTSVQVVNSVIAGNSAMYGGGTYCYSSSPTILNSTIVGNSATGYGGGGIYCGNASPTAVNTILWENGPDEIYLKYSSIDVSYCDVQDGWPGEGNIDADPLFVNVEGADGVIGTDDDDLHLLPGSPCIDAGENLAVPESAVADLDGGPRIINGTVDMGAYEATATSAATIHYVDAHATGNNNGSSWSNA